MAYLKLFITDLSSPELYATRFLHRKLEEEILAVRGKTGEAFSSEFTFQWTAGTKALSVLLVKSAASRVLSLKEDLPKLVGERGSLAMSLENALGNETAWLVDVFGSDNKGVPLIRRLFKRGNPDQKRPGPVAVSLNPTEWREMPIQVYVSDVEVDDPEVLASLAASLEAQTRISRQKKLSKKAAKDTSLAERDISSWKSWFPKVLFQEIREMLIRSDVFNPSQVARTVTSINENESFRHASAKHPLLLSSVDRELLSANRLGVLGDDAVLKRALCPADPIRIAVPATIPASAALFCYLQYVKGYNITVDMSVAHTVELAERLASGGFRSPPDGCCLAVAPAASFLSACAGEGYLPMMMMPKISQRIVGKKGSVRGVESLSSGKYLFIRESPSVPLFVFEDLEREGLIRKSQVDVAHMEPDEVLGYLSNAEEDVRAILFFPHYYFNAWFNEAEIFPDPRDDLRCQECFLFVSKALMGRDDTARALDIALRDAWLELKTNDQAVQDIVDTLLTRTNYMKYVARFAGLHNLIK